MPEELHGFRIASFELPEAFRSPTFLARRANDHRESNGAKQIHDAGQSFGVIQLACLVLDDPAEQKGE